MLSLAKGTSGFREQNHNDEKYWLSNDKKIAVFSDKITFTELTPKTIELSLKIAIGQLGNTLNLTGTEEQKNIIIQHIANNPEFENVQFKDPKQQAKLEQLRLEINEQRNLKTENLLLKTNAEYEKKQHEELKNIINPIVKIAREIKPDLKTYKEVSQIIVENNDELKNIIKAQKSEINELNEKYKQAREDLKNSKTASQKDYQDLKIKSEKDNQELKTKHSQDIEKYKAEQSQLQEPRVEIKTITQEVDSQKLAQEIEQIKTSERLKVISEIQKDSPTLLTKLLKLDEYKKPSIFIQKDTTENPYVKKFKDTVFYKSEQTEIQPDAKLEELTKKVSELENKQPKIEYRDIEVVKYKEQPENETYNEVRGIMKATNEILKMQDKPLAYNQKDYQELKLIKDNSSKLNELKTARQKSLELEQEKFKRTQEEQETRINTLEMQSKTSNVQTYQPTTKNANESEKTLFERVRECLTKEQNEELDKKGYLVYQNTGFAGENVIRLTDSPEIMTEHYQNLKGLTIEQKPQEQSKSKGMSW